MRICFVSKGTLGEFREQTKETENETLSETERADIVLFGFGGGVEVSYERELKGETNYFEEAALLSKSGKNIVVCGYTTNARGHKRRSVLVAENGRLAGVSDMLNVIDGEWNAGACARLRNQGGAYGRGRRGRSELSRRRAFARDLRQRFYRLSVRAVGKRAYFSTPCACLLLRRTHFLLRGRVLHDRRRFGCDRVRLTAKPRFRRFQTAKAVSLSRNAAPRII